MQFFKVKRPAEVQSLIREAASRLPAERVRIEAALGRVLAEEVRSPVDLPAFPAGQSKGLHTFTYEAVPGLAGHKAVGEVGFQVTVEQDFTAMTDPQVKALADDPFVKGLNIQPTVGVWLKGPHGLVRQLWKPGVPWPVCSENGTTTSRLVEFKPARKAGEVQR